MALCYIYIYTKPVYHKPVMGFRMAAGAIIFNSAHEYAWHISDTFTYFHRAQKLFDTLVMATFVRITLMRTKNYSLLSLKSFSSKYLSQGRHKGLLHATCVSSSALLRVFICLNFLHMTRNTPQNTFFATVMLLLLSLFIWCGVSAFI